ncbi:MAG: WYL domain-containing protein [Paramuribaculum sp.]|nr:WYL domain-containing protein [Paramuribaculum sp.]
MPAVLYPLRRYVWLIDTLRTFDALTLPEIQHLWEINQTLRREDDSGLDNRTFHRHRQAISDIFGLEIKCNRNRDNKYRIANIDKLLSPTFTSWLFNGLAIDNHLMGNEQIANRIVFEESPGGMELMPTIINALSQRRKLKVTYHSISHGCYDEAIMEPYFVKERLRRWYVIGRVDGRRQPVVFALDRISLLHPLDETFNYPKDIDPATYFDEVVGILLDEEYDCERVVVRIYGRQRHYVTLLPIHKTQKEINRGEDYIDFEYNLRPEYEFVHEILRLGFDAEILTPAWLRDELHWQAQQIARRYGKKVEY